MVQNIDVAINEVNNGLCLSLSNSQYANPPFSLKSLNCNQKGSVVCRLENLKTISPQKPTTFPCMIQQQTSRKKRSDIAYRNGQEILGHPEHDDGKCFFNFFDRCNGVDINATFPHIK